MQITKVQILSLLLLAASFFCFIEKGSELIFEKKTLKFDKVDEGKLVTLIYYFTNESNQPVIFKDYKTSCHCTKAILPKAPLTPNQKGEIKVTFDTNKKIGYQERTINIITNLGEYELKFKGVVNASKETIEEYKQKN